MPISSGPRFYRRKATFEALQWDGSPEATVHFIDWLPGRVRVTGPEMLIDGATKLGPGNWLVISGSGRLHVCIPGLFEEVHELALADPEDSDLANMQAGMNAARSASNYWKKMAQNLAARLGVELPKPAQGTEADGSPGKYPSA